MTLRTVLLLSAAVALAATTAPLVSTTLLGKQPDNSFLLANHQLVKPWGTQTFFKGRPVDLAFDPRSEESGGSECNDRAGGQRHGERDARACGGQRIFRPGSHEIRLGDVQGHARASSLGEG